MMASVTVLSLAGGAVVGRALALREAADRRAAIAAGLIGALIDEELLAEVSGIALRIHIVAQRRAAHTDGLFQHFANGGDQPRGFIALEAAALPTRPDAGLEQHFTGVDVPDSGDHLA